MDKKGAPKVANVTQGGRRYKIYPETPATDRLPSSNQGDLGKLVESLNLESANPQHVAEISKNQLGIEYTPQEIKNMVGELDKSPHYAVSTFSNAYNRAQNIASTLISDAEKGKRNWWVAVYLLNKFDK